MTARDFIAVDNSSDILIVLQLAFFLVRTRVEKLLCYLVLRREICIRIFSN